VNRLETLLVLPYAAGEQVTHADLYVVPCLAHTMAAGQTKEVGDLSKLEEYIRKPMPDFKLGQSCTRGGSITHVAQLSKRCFLFCTESNVVLNLWADDSRNTKYGNFVIYNLRHSQQ
jgi:hypothetical protein